MPIFMWLKSLPSTKLYPVLGCSIFLFLFSTSVIAQNTIEVHIDDGQATSTCVDGFGANAEPLWQVSIEGEDWMVYGDALCYNTTPNTQFTTSVDCLGDLRGGEIQVCFSVFENDNSLLDPCKIDMDCEQMICKYFVLPLAGEMNNYNLSIPDGLDSGGSLSFSISVDGAQNGAVNDHICHAINLGTIDNRTVQEKGDLKTYNNFCATATEEVDPKKVNGSFTNNAGVWFSFNTGNDPSELILIEAFNDPESTGDIINLQLALYQLDTDCSGEATYITDHHNSGVLDEHLLLECLSPNQEYYLLVDGVFDDTNNLDVPELEGYFSIRIREIAVEGGNDDICGAINLQIEEGGTKSYTNFFNNCATNIDDPIVENYPSIQPVWFQFTPPLTHRAFIEVTSHLPYPNGIDPIEPQIAVFSSDDDTCMGNLTKVSHHYENDDPDNGITMGCLDPNKTYWIMIDGSVTNPTGMFDISITDPGYPELKKFNATTCQGMPYTIGNQLYTTEGTYIDTVLFAEGCLEILETTLSFADSLLLEIDVVKLAGGLDVSDGNANVSVTGGSGVHTITWSDGTGDPIGKDLTGGTEYCIAVVDSVGCMLDTCFEMPYVIPIKTTLKNDTLDCFGDNDGLLVLAITKGRPPYNYELFSVDKGLTLKKGTIVDTTVSIRFPGLIAGSYKVFVNTANNSMDKSAKVLAPKAIDISIMDKIEASCHNTCDAVVDLLVEGGNGDFDFKWSDEVNRGQSAIALCGGDYQITVTDEKQCTATLDLNIAQPAAFFAKAAQTKAVSCFGENNGEAMVNANNPTNFVWDNGDTTAIANDLTAGIHTVVVSNEENCTDTALVEIMEPASLIATIDVLSTINCFGEHNGLLEGMATGGNGNFSYLWNNNSTATLNDNLPAGSYSVTVTDAIGCTNNISLDLSQPSALSTQITKQDVTCPGGPKSGEIFIAAPVGGIAPYAYSLNGTAFSTTTSFNNLNADSYDVTTQDANGCSITETMTINDPPVLVVELGEPQTLKLGKTIQLTALANLPVSYQWNVADNSDCTDCKAMEITPTASTMYKVTVTDVNTDCVATDDVFISIDNNRDVYVPNAFSPNGDGYNDNLMIYGGSNIKLIKAFKVFDRHGNLVYQADNFPPNDSSTSWKGDFNGQRLASALFIYWAEVEFIDGYSDIYKGDIALFR